MANSNYTLTASHYLLPLQDMSCADEVLLRLHSAIEAGLQAGHTLRTFYTDHCFGVYHKGEIDMVTDADLASERIILETISRDYSDAIFLSEETHASLGYETGEFWVIDPLDGTTNFAHGFPWFAISIACVMQGEVVAGLVYLPLQNELFYAVRGGGAWLNGTRIRVSSTHRLAHALLATGFPYDVHQEHTQVIAALQAVLIQVQGVRRAGAAAIDLVYVACGRLDGFWEIKLKPWDTAAGVLILKEAGGRVSLFGEEPYSMFSKEILATNGLLHQELSRILRDFRAYDTFRR